MDEPSGPRWELALDLLRGGEPYLLGVVTFRRISEDVIEAAVASRWQPQNVTEAKAHDDLETARGQTEALLAADADFRAAVGSSRIEYVLIYDYETGSIGMCRLAGREVQWLIDPK